MFPVVKFRRRIRDALGITRLFARIAFACLSRTNACTRYRFFHYSSGAATVTGGLSEYSCKIPHTPKYRPTLAPLPPPPNNLSEVPGLAPDSAASNLQTFFPPYIQIVDLAQWKSSFSARCGLTPTSIALSLGLCILWEGAALLSCASSGKTASDDASSLPAPFTTMNHRYSASAPSMCGPVSSSGSYSAALSTAPQYTSDMCRHPLTRWPHPSNRVGTSTYTRLSNG
ncbi:hypothetical protein FISHEDRAFT_73860 [Fistulina hepatica ATCC 64428]|uniref:Uncharacterized protein n=1 Tax=Fistulina hepatica ATCC 64428 TaxID=1128425 RepID=A0A0D7ABE2_9AGAR|nr:hypothetical protein FISHEDRAFT_73860 [Fistulina hepatica ATCC 64428]